MHKVLEEDKITGKALKRKLLSLSKQNPKNNEYKKMLKVLRGKERATVKQLKQKLAPNTVSLFLNQKQAAKKKIDKK